MKKGKRYWCWWMSRYLIFKYQNEDKFIFEDFGDQTVILTKDEVERLVEK